MKKIAFIPARSGSKRLPHKNIKMLHDKPLIVWTVEAFVKSNCFDKIIFSSDSLEYFEILNRYIKSDLLEFYQRDKLETGDQVKIFDYVKSNIKNWCSKEDILSLALPTCPFRNEKHIKECLDLSIKTGKSVFTACEYDFHVPFAFSMNVLEYEANWSPLFKDSPMITGNTRSQDQIKYFHPNGAIYVLRADLFRNDIKTFYENSIPYIMEKIDSIDIDNKEDLEIAEFIAKHKIRTNN